MLNIHNIKIKIKELNKNKSSQVKHTEVISVRMVDRLEKKQTGIILKIIIKSYGNKILYYIYLFILVMCSRVCTKLCILKIHIM